MKAAASLRHNYSTQGSHNKCNKHSKYSGGVGSRSSFDDFAVKDNSAHDVVARFGFVNFVSAHDG
jgi:hypothetical protein